MDKPNMGRIQIWGVLVDFSKCMINRFLHGQDFVPPSTTSKFH